ncbi:MAG: DUF5610 domain-containing protein [Mariprofundaceae bacterium]
MDIGTLKHSATHHKDVRTNSDHETKKTSEKPDKIDVKQAKQATKAMIMQQLINVDMGSLSKSQELLFRSVIEKLDEILAPIQGKNATQKAADAGIDFSPEATAQRITSHASGMIARFQSENQLEQDDPKLEEFINLIQASIQKGFEYAKGILSGFEVFNDDVENNFEATRTEVLKNMNAIRTELGLELIPSTEPTEDDQSNPS